MNKLTTILAMVLALATVVTIKLVLKTPPSPTLVPLALQAPELPLLQHTERSIELSSPRISAARKKLLATMITDIAKKTFRDRKNQEFWVALIGVESRYESTARSPVGAVGLGQLLPQYRNDFGKACGITEVDAQDIQDDYMNLSLSACYFRTLIEQSRSVTLAMAAYNGGMSSSGFKKASIGGSPSQETSAYVTRINVQRDRTKQVTGQE